MNKNICIFGFGGFAKEVYWLAKECQRNVVAFIDNDNKNYDLKYDNVSVRSIDFFNKNKHLAVIAIGNPYIRNKIVNELSSDAHFDTLIHPSVKILSSTCLIGKGSVICANVVLTCDIGLGNFSQLNLATTIGHDVKVGDFFTTAPGVHINGKNKIGNNVYFGSNSSTIDNISIVDDVVIGAGACVVKSITKAGTYVGVPAKNNR